MELPAGVLVVLMASSCVFPSGRGHVLQQEPGSRRNVLFLVSDDMRPDLACYRGPYYPTPVHPDMVTPHLDKLASRSLLLKRAYVQQAVCNPSRSSLLTGRRPDTTHVYDSEYFRKSGGNFVTIPQYFKENGYAAVGMGKIFHPGAPSGFDDPLSWSRPYYHAESYDYWQHVHGSWKAVPGSEYTKRPLPDMELADHAIKVLKEFASPNHTRPFFLAVGFHKPHIPIVFPEEFLNYYPPDSIYLPKDPCVPRNFPEIAWNACRGLASYPDIRALNATLKFNTSLPDFKTLELRRAYYSAVSYVDTLVGQIIKELEVLGLDKNTVISFFGDHGFQLGEHGEWCKETNFELATHAPMMLHIPGITDKGYSTEAITEFVDLFPSLVEAAGLPQLPACPENSTHVHHCTQGQSFLQLLSEDGKEWKNVAFSQFPRSRGSVVMGYSIRTDTYRYTEWPVFHPEQHYTPDWHNLYGAELYDHSKDPQENNNVANDAKYAKIREVLRKALRAGPQRKPIDIAIGTRV